VLVEPFLTGVFGDRPLLTSSRVTAMIWRSFVSLPIRRARVRGHGASLGKQEIRGSECGYGLLAQARL
jgi:hypothetical protein